MFGFKKINIKTHTEEIKNIEAIETWVVKWITFKNCIDMAYTIPKFQCFSSKEMAMQFAKQIDDAYNLLGARYQSVVYTEKNGL